MREERGGVLYASMWHIAMKIVLDSQMNMTLVPFGFVFYMFLSVPSKTALLEGLEVDQYMWGILNAIQK